MNITDKDRLDFLDSGKVKIIPDGSKWTNSKGETYVSKFYGVCNNTRYSGFKSDIRGLIDVMIKNSSMRIEPEFLVGDLEFSEVLPKKYDWNTLMNTEFNEGWRVPKRGEIMMLYDEVEESHAKSHINDWFWSASPNASNSDNAWRIDFYDGYDGSSNKSNAYAARLVREVSK